MADFLLEGFVVRLVTRRCITNVVHVCACRGRGFKLWSHDVTEKDQRPADIDVRDSWWICKLWRVSEFVCTYKMWEAIRGRCWAVGPHLRDAWFQIKGLMSLKLRAKCGKEEENRRTWLKMADFLLRQKNPQNQFLAVSMSPVSPVNLMKIREGLWSHDLALGGTVESSGHTHNQWCHHLMRRMYRVLNLLSADKHSETSGRW